jgi:hypothetical protein
MANAVCRHHIPKQRHRLTNWRAYDASLRQRESLTIWFTDEAIAVHALNRMLELGGPKVRPHRIPLAWYGLKLRTLRSVQHGCATRKDFLPASLGSWISSETLHREASISVAIRLPVKELA